MKTFKFNICKYTITVTIKKKPYKTSAHTIDHAPNTLTVDKPISYYVSDKLLNEYKSDSVLAPVKEHIRPISEAIKMKDDISQQIRYTSFYECCLEYINLYCSNLSPNTIIGYKNIVNNHFIRMRSYDISKVDQIFIQKMFDEEIEKGYSKKTIKSYRSFILKVLAVYRPDLKPEIRVEKELAE